MKNNLENNLRHSVISALKTMCEIDFLPDTRSRETEEILAAHISFWGGRSGEMVLTANKTLLEVLLIKFMNMNEDPTPDEVNEFFKELINIVSGNLMPLLYPIQETIHLSSPQILPDPPW